MNFPNLQMLAEMKQAPLDLPKTPIDRFLPTHGIDKAEIVKALDLAKKKTGLDLATLPAKDIGDKVKEIRKVLLDVADEDLDLSAAVMHISAALWKLSKRR